MKKQLDDFECINLDETSEWSKLDIEEAVSCGEVPDLEQTDYLDEETEDDLESIRKIDEKKKSQSIKKKKTKKNIQKKVSFYGRFISMVRNMTAIDGIIAATGVLILVVAIVTVSVYTSAEAARKQVELMAPIGREMSEFGVIGEDKFLAVADAKQAVAQMVMTQEPQQVTQYDEKEEESQNISITMSLTSVQKDLKIKFLNAKTKKLVSNVGFLVEIKDADQKTYTKEDDDKDGIIYIKSMPPGETTVTMLELKGENNITFLAQPQTVKVKEKIDYKKIDVSDEIKSESQVNAKAEDTAVANQVEAALTDTVEWVESTRVEIGSDNGYAEVKKDSITDPSAVASGLFIRMDTPIQPSPNPSPWTPTPETAPSPEAEPSPQITPGVDVQPSPEVPISPEVTQTPTAEPSPEITLSPEVTPSSTPVPTPTKVPASQDKTTLLKDKNGNQIFIKDSSGKYIEAKYADYYNYSVFYVKASSVQYRYTGWQDIDGKTYFFDKNGNKVTGEQVIQGARYTFSSDGALVVGSGTMGIDVSKWNGNINWDAVKNSGVSYVIIRCGYRGSTTGALIEDPKFKANIQGATKAGLKVGIYFFTQAVNEVEAVEEASMTIGLIKNYRISYPVFLDVEASGGRADGLDAGARTNVINAYCQTIRNSGYTAGVYANKTWLTQKMNAGALSSYKIWLAQYNTAPTYTGKIDLWQYTSKGQVGGISGNTDMNLSYLGY